MVISFIGWHRFSYVHFFSLRYVYLCRWNDFVSWERKLFHPQDGILIGNPYINSYLRSDPKIAWHHNYTVNSKSIENVWLTNDIPKYSRNKYRAIGFFSHERTQVQIRPKMCTLTQNMRKRTCLLSENVLNMRQGVEREKKVRL